MIIIERKREQVSVGGRTFELTEMTGTELTQYVRDQVNATERTALDLGGRDEVALDEAAQVVMRELTSLLVHLLANPTDGAPPPDEEWVEENVSYRMRLELISTQDELNSLKELVGKAHGLQRRGRAMLQARQG
jgi:hypothetical protein